MTGSLATTNLLLGIMAVVSIIEGLVILGLGIAGWMAYRRVMALVSDIEERQIAPAMAQVSAILDDVKGVSAKVKEETGLVDTALRSAVVARADATAGRIRSSVRGAARRVSSTIVGVGRAVAGAVSATDRRQPREA
jgi:hypothetical protein